MVGQLNLISTIDKYNLDNFPHSILLLGEKGSGRHLICKYISEKFNLSFIDISETISDEVIDNIYRRMVPSLYLINLDNMTEKEQNILLKFIEEPLKNSFIILIAENKNFILNTIINRCLILQMDFYTKEELREFTQNETVLNYIRTPGKILTTNLENLDSLVDLCNKMVDKMNQAGYANTLSITNKINYKDEYNKYDFDLFLDILSNKFFNEYNKTNNKLFLDNYILTLNERKKLSDKRINKEIFMYNYLTKLWEMYR